MCNVHEYCATVHILIGEFNSIVLLTIYMYINLLLDAGMMNGSVYSCINKYNNK